MGKRRSGKGGKGSMPIEPKPIDERSFEKPDPKSRHFYHDEVDEFHNEREKIRLSNLRKDRAASSDEELYKVAVDSEEELLDDEDQAEEDSDDMRSDIEETADNDYLPSADTWGKKKKDFYSTDYVDKDYGGYLSESDEEAARLEEVEAKSLQKRLAEQMTEEDFVLNQPKSTSESTDIARKDESLVTEEENVDVSNLTESEKLDYLRHRHPEFLGLVEDFKAKSKIVEGYLRPVVEGMKAGIIPSTRRLNLIQLRFEAYSNYLLNVNFYFLLKANQSSLKNHPIIDRIVEWRKVMNEIDRKCENLTDNLETLSSALKQSDAAEISAKFRFIHDDEDGKSAERSLKSDVGRKVKKATADDDKDNDEEAFYDFNGTEDDDPKRAATYEMLKNKGTTPRRKKEDRNPRVKHRRKFEKALHKKRSLVPDVRKELKKYAGEDRGIKPNLVKSIKLH